MGYRNRQIALMFAIGLMVAGCYSETPRVSTTPEDIASEVEEEEEERQRTNVEETTIIGVIVSGVILFVAGAVIGAGAR